MRRRISRRALNPCLYPGADLKRTPNGPPPPPYRSIPDGHFWAVADNDELPAAAACDSRTLGPLPLGSILGRVVYSARSAADHGGLENSEAAMETDSPVLAHELELGAAEQLVGLLAAGGGGMKGGAAQEGGGPPAASG